MGLQVRYSGRPERVRFIARPNRYLAWVQRPARRARTLVHLPNPGRMEELLIPKISWGTIVPVAGAGRKTRFDLIAVRHGRTWVSVDSRLANRLVALVLARDALPVLRGSRRWNPEFRVGKHRFDFGRSRPDGQLEGLLEVKSSNLRVGTTALFPDAPTRRGERHLRELARQSQIGVDASVLFLIQRPDVRRFAPNRALDPKFAEAFDAAHASGVRFLARTSRVFPGGLEWGRSVPVFDGLAGERLL